jgi:hypothetical protein
MKHLVGLALLFGCCSSTCVAAEYQGSDVDGESYSCTAYSYSTSNYYNLTCEFSGDEVTLYFPNSGHINVSMDSDEIEDPSAISAYDYNKSAYWDLDVDM